MAASQQERLLEAQGRAQTAFAFYHGGRFEEAVAQLRLAVELHPGFEQAFNLLGLSLKALKRFDEAGNMVAAAFTIRPGYHEPVYNLALMLDQNGETALAERFYRMALESLPDGPAVLGNLGNLLRRTGRASEAEPFLRRATEAAPDDATAAGNLALLCLELGKAAEARTHAERATRLAPDEALWWETAGTATRLLPDPDAAVPLLERAAALAPADAEVALELGLARDASADHAGALAAFDTARKLDPASMNMRWADALSLPMVIDNDAEGIAALERFDTRLEGLASDLHLDSKEGVARALEAASSHLPFALHYLPGDHTERQSRLASLYARVARAAVPHATAPVPRAPRAGRIRVGFVSRYLRTHVVARFFGASITRLDPAQFERTVWLAGGPGDAWSDEIARSVERFELAPQGLRETAERILAQRLDVLVFTDVGLDPMQSLLASLRLAPVQAALYGHPVTTGLDSIDDFLSGDALEPAEGASHYRERLVRLPGLGAKPLAPGATGDATWARALREPGRPLAMCAQNLIKIPPAFDAVLAEILARSGARLAMFDRRPGITRKFRERFSRALAAHKVPESRVVFAPLHGYPDYLAGIAEADLLLDTPGFSGGATSLDALGLGLPIVAFEGAQARGRQTSAMLRLAGVEELVARDDASYTECALAVLADPARRQTLRERLKAGVPAIFSDDRPLEAFAAYLRSAAA